MRIPGILVLVVATIGLNAAPVAAQLKPNFGSLRADPSRPTPHGPRINVDFGQGLPRPAVTPRPQTALPPLQPMTVSSSVTVTAGVPAIDCAMVRQAPGNIDPKFVQRPAPGVRHTMRIIPVAPCPAK